MIDTIAMNIGTSARNDANTKASTARAPRPPTTASTRMPGTLSVLAAVLHERVVAGQVHRRAGHRDTAQLRPCPLRRVRVLAEGGVRVAAGKGDREGRAAVGRHERAVTGGRVRGDPCSWQRALDARIDCAQLRPHARGINGLARGERHDGEERRRVAARVPILLRDLDVGLVPLLAGHRELLREGIRGGAGGPDADDGQQEPEGDDCTLVGEDPTGEGRQRVTSASLIASTICTTNRFWR